MERRTTPPHHSNEQMPPPHRGPARTTANARTSLSSPCFPAEDTGQYESVDEEESIGSAFSNPLAPNRNTTPERTNAKSLTTRTEKELLKLLISPQRCIKFSQVCNKKHDLFGLPCSKLRKQVQNRRSFLLRLQVTDPHAFVEICTAHNLQPTKDQTEPAPDIDKVNKQHTLSPPPDEVQNPRQRTATMASSHLLRKLTSLLLFHLANYNVALIFLILPCFAYHDHGSVEPEEEHYLDLKNPENNPSGIFVLSVTDEFSSELLDVLWIYKEVSDIWDAKDNVIKASLLPDGTGIEVIEPKAARFLYKDVKQIHHLEGSDACTPIYRAHKAAANEIKKHTHRQLKKIILKFPKGMTCNASRFNGDSSKSSLKLKNNLRMLETVVNKNPDGDNVMGTVQWLIWKVVIEGAPRILNSSDDESDDDFEDARKRMGMLKTY